ncbi:MAG: hypothetical protein V1903_00805 [Bacteroidota bacterium]
MNGKVLKKDSAEKNPAVKGKSSKISPLHVNIEKPGEDEIRELANDLYQARIMMGEDGSDIDDWLLAEAKLSDNI